MPPLSTKKLKNKIEIIDYIYPIIDLPKKKYRIKDHINLTGKNPLKGPHFLPLSNIYNSQNGLIIAGLEEGNVPNASEIKVLKACNVSAYSYTLIPTVILSIHRGLKVHVYGIIKDSLKK